LPTFHYLQGFGDFIIPGISISSKGKVRSVKFFYSGDIKDIKKIEVDEGSVTSVALLRIILKEVYSIEPDFVPKKFKNLNTLGNTPALLIGDYAFVRNGNHLDLGEEWTKLTGLPFVYAFWVAKKEADLDYITCLLNESKEYGLKNIDKIVNEASYEIGLERQKIRSYLKDTIIYDFGSEHIEGLLKFAEYACKLGLLTHKRDVVCYDSLKDI
jgi:chorismate dehydratase